MAMSNSSTDQIVSELNIPVSIIPEEQDFEFLSEGSFGKVYRVRDKSTNTECVHKEICYEKALLKFKDWISIPKLFREVENWKQIKHPNVVTYLDSWICGPNSEEIINNTYKIPDLTSTSTDTPLNTNYLVIKMEYCNSTFVKWLENWKVNPKNEFCIDIFFQLTEGLNAIHQQNIIHRDLTPDNIFLCGTTFKIGDFGLSIQSKNLDDEEKSARKGTTMYQSPEMARGDKNYTNKTDVYSLALNFLLIINRSLLENDHYRRGEFFELREGLQPENTLIRIINGVSPIYSVLIPIIIKMLTHNPNDRVDTDQVLQKLQDQLVLNNVALNITRGESQSIFKLEEHCLNFKIREKDLQTFEIFLKLESGSPLKAAVIYGENAVGKSVLARKIGNDFFDNGGSCSWFSCLDIAKTFKEFCYSPESKVNYPWMIIFDGVDIYSVGCLKLILDKLRTVSIVKPDFILVTTRMKPSEFGLTWDLELKLNYNWVKRRMSENQGNLGTFMRLILKSNINSSYTTKEKREQCMNICEAFGSLKTSYETVICSFSLIILIGLLYSGEGISKHGFIRFWKLFAGKSDKNVKSILNVFFSVGILLISGPENPDNENNENDEKILSWCNYFLQKLKHLVGYEEEEKIDKDKYIITSTKTIFSEMILSHPMTKFIIQNALEIDMSSEIGILQRILQTYKRIILADGAKKVNLETFNLHINIATHLLPEILQVDELVLKFHSEIARLVRDASTQEMIRKAYAKFAELLGQYDLDTLYVTGILAEIYRTEENYLNCLKFKQILYKGYKEKYGGAHIKTIDAGIDVAEIHKKLQKFTEAVIICKEIVKSFEVEWAVGTTSSKMVTIQEDKLTGLKKVAYFLKKSDKAEAIKVYELILNLTANAEEKEFLNEFIEELK